MVTFPAREHLEVYVNEFGYVCLKQQDGLGNETGVVSLEPAQAKEVGKLLAQLAEEAEPKFSAGERQLQER